MQQGDRFGSYTLEEKIAAGGMAEIFRARRVGVAGFARQVCIKRILPSLCTDKGFVDMFVDEARTGAQLRHGNIVTIDDFGEVDGQYYLCMELVSGVDLSRLERLLARQGVGVPAGIAVYVAGEVLRALDYAHRKLGADGAPLGIVHRDVSPQNVLVSFAGEVKLTDFGIARATSRLHQTMGDVIKGKLSYMSPEQIYGHPLDARLDLFALGVVLFELLAGRRPFGGKNEAEVVSAILQGRRASLREARPDVPAAFVAIVDRLLEQDRDRRYPNAGAALADLAVLQSGVSGARLMSGLMGYLYPEHASAVRGDVSGFTASALVPMGTGPGSDDATTPDEPEPTTNPLAATAPASEPRDDEDATRVDASPTLELDVLDHGIPATVASDATAVAPVIAARAAAAARAAGERETSANEPTRTMTSTALGGASAPAAVAPVLAPRAAGARARSAERAAWVTVLAASAALLVVVAAAYALLGTLAPGTAEVVARHANQVPLVDAGPVPAVATHDAARDAAVAHDAAVARDAAVAARVLAADAGAPSAAVAPGLPHGAPRAHHAPPAASHITTAAPF